MDLEDSDSMNQIIPIYPIKNMIGEGLFMQVQKKESHMIFQNQKGKTCVTTTTYVDANLHHDQVTGRAVTACLHLVNATPSHWHTKRQASVETATFGSGWW